MNKYTAIVLFQMLVFALPIIFLIIIGKPYNEKVDSEAINGILTASSIILGFTTISEYNRPMNVENLLTFFLFLPIFVLGLTGFIYFLDLVSYGFLTFRSLQFATSSLFVTLNNWVFLKTVLKNLIEWG